MRTEHIFCAVILNFLPIDSFGQSSEFAPMALNGYSALPTRFAAAKVFQQDGVLLGNIQRLERGPGGIPNVLMIGVAGPRIISVAAADASYDAVNNIVVTDMTATTTALAGK
jgi:hypothetical protein